MGEKEPNYQDLARIFKALGHPTRLQILMKTFGGKFCVSDLEQDLERSQPNISQHLGVLRERGLVVSERDGQKVCYHPADKKIEQIIQTAARILNADT
ncbi:MAG: metalloregulator ArsR/SmtB family transcription factor [Armatimonadota bacterium]